MIELSLAVISFALTVAVVTMEIRMNELKRHLNRIQDTVDGLPRIRSAGAMPWSTSVGGSAWPSTWTSTSTSTPGPFTTFGSSGNECNHCGNEHPTLKDAVLYHKRRANEWRMESIRIGSGILPSDVEKEDQLVKSLSMGLAPLANRFPVLTKKAIAK